LIDFCTLSGKIESLTDTWTLYDEEPTSSEKETLLNLLRKFIKILPDSKGFKNWTAKA